MFLVTLFIERRKKQNPPESSSTEEWLNKQQCVCSVVYLAPDERVKGVNLPSWKITQNIISGKITLQNYT